MAKYGLFRCEKSKKWSKIDFFNSKSLIFKKLNVLVKNWHFHLRVSKIHNIKAIIGGVAELTKAIALDAQRVGFKPQRSTQSVQKPILNVISRTSRWTTRGSCAKSLDWGFTHAGKARTNKYLVFYGISLMNLLKYFKNYNLLNKIES